MIDEAQAISLLIEACPDFQEVWDSYCADWVLRSKPGICLAFGEFAHHIVELLLTKHTERFAITFQAVEQLAIDGTILVQESVATCFLETLQNVAGNRDVDASLFLRWLGPQSRYIWLKLDEY